jgi:hypothetical protein
MPRSNKESSIYGAAQYDKKRRHSENDERPYSKIGGQTNLSFQDLVLAMPRTFWN